MKGNNKKRTKTQQMYNSVQDRIEIQFSDVNLSRRWLLTQAANLLAAL